MAFALVWMLGGFCTFWPVSTHFCFFWVFFYVPSLPFDRILCNSLSYQEFHCSPFFKKIFPCTPMSKVVVITSLMVMIFSKPKEGLQWKYNVAISKVAFSHYVLFSFFFFLPWDHPLVHLKCLLAHRWFHQKQINRYKNRSIGADLFLVP